MASSQASPQQRVRIPWATFVVGVPLAVGVLALFRVGPLRDTEMARYVSHEVECVEVLMFCCALSAFGAKLWNSRGERAAFKKPLLPAWDGRPVPISEAGSYLAGLEKSPRRLARTFLFRRASGILHFLLSRGSTKDLDDQLRAASDNDIMAVESSYSLTRFITWAIPILGFLGTVLGITRSISGITPEKLEQDLSQVTDGLALAFDATALGLALTMVAMFINFLVERTENGILEAVDAYAERQLAHRFERVEGEGNELVAAVHKQTKVLLEAVEQMVQRQADIWSTALAEIDHRRAEAESRLEQRLMTALEGALNKTLEAHSRRLASLEKQSLESNAKAIEQVAAQARAVCEAGREHQSALAKIVQGLAGHAQTVSKLQDGEKQLLHLQQTLNQNLTALAGAGAFEQAVHSLTAAIHLLTTRMAAGAPLSEAGRSGPRSGVAA
jgi:biopolymer transport protein ExbB/TolQ